MNLFAGYVGFDDGEWIDARLGRVTASRLSDVMAKGRSGEPSRTRASYMAELICERLTGRQYEGFQSADMARGNELEADAKQAYAFIQGVDIQDGGFDLHPSVPDFGASPDSHVGSEGHAEFKCPKSSTHLDTFLSGKIDREYLLQMQGQMACTGRKWCDFVSYDPRFPLDMQLFIKRVPRDDELIKVIENEVVAFLGELADKMASIGRVREGASP